MRIDVALKERFNISRQKAKALIEEGNVSLNGKPAVKPSQEVSGEDVLKIESSDILKYVGRGGLKLEKALSVFNITPENMVCLDIGASTGGFTDCLLQKGAKKVYAVDVGSSQLADRLKNNGRVVSMENTDIRRAEIECVDFICMDVSFISVIKVIYRVSELLKEDGTAVILIKPQFEAGRENVNKNGVVKNPKVHKRVIRDIISVAVGLKLGIKGLTYSPVRGGDGNIEYLLYLVKNPKESFMPDIDAVVTEAEKGLNR